ncbi:hypothetical protein ACOSQ4_002586 [Xanthoceras sorbifolium]
MCQLPWLVAGDFNEILFANEKSSGTDRPKYLINNFREALCDCALEDLGSKGHPFTWCNGRSGDAFVQERINRGVSNFEWWSLFPGSSVSHLDFWKSYHEPRLVRVTEAVNDLVQQQFHPHRFKFEQYWLKDEESDAIVARCWEKHCPGDAMHGVLSKISQCGSQLQKWGVLKRNQLRSSLMHKRATLKHVNEILSSNDWRQLRKIEKELEDLIRVDKVYWKQRSQVQWLKRVIVTRNIFMPKLKLKEQKIIWWVYLMIVEHGMILLLLWRMLFNIIIKIYSLPPGLLMSIWQWCLIVFDS